MSELPSGWVKVPLGDVGDLHCGQSPSVPTVNQNGIGTPYVTGPEQWDGRAFRNPKWTTDPRRIVPEGCVFITVKGAGVGKTFPGVACAIGRDVYAFEPSNEMDYQFSLKTISFRATEIIEEARGDIPGLSKSHIADYEAGIPPLPEQRRIVRKLDTLSARITNARTHLTAIAKLVERMRGAVLSKALNGTLLPEQIGIGEPTELGQFILGIEQGWSPKCDNEPELNPDEWAVLTTTAIQAIDFDSTENKKLPSYLEPRPHLEVQVGDVLMTRAGPRVRCAVCSFVSATSPRRIFSDKVYRIRLDSSVDPEFFVMMMNTPELVKALDVIKSGGSESGLNLTQGRLKSLSINLWDVATQSDVVAEIKTQFAKIDRLAAEAEKALKLTDRLDQRILAKAFAGELVPQDPSDEPATELLARIRKARATAPKPKRGRRKKVAT